MPFCPNCGNQTGQGDPFCGECGARQEVAPSPVSRQTAAPRPPAPVQNSPLGFHLQANTVLADRYQVHSRVGGGGMGSVYRAVDRNLANRTVAIKEMIEMFADASARAKAIEDFKRESELLARLEHPSIPTIYDYFFDSARGRYYLVMKFIDGGDLANYQQSVGGVIDEQTVTKWAIQICDVLDYIHSQNPPLIYRDLKPANLMLDSRSQRVMLVDFGIARFVAPSQKGVTAVGTMGYAPPELFSGKVVPGSDLYSLGATMFHLVTGKDPQDNPLLIFDFSRNPRPRAINPGISEKMEQIICRAVEHDAALRFASASAFRRELEEHYETFKGNSPAIIAAKDEGTKIISEALLPSPPPSPELPRKCSSCSTEIATGDIFCANCGARVSTGNTAQLMVLGTNEIAAQFPVDMEAEHLIGRPDPATGIIPAVDLSRFDSVGGVSRRHARIISRGNQFMIEDLGSSNGTYINDQIRLAPQKPHILTSGDLVRLGSTSLKFLIS